MGGTRCIAQKLATIEGVGHDAVGEGNEERERLPEVESGLPLLSSANMCRLPTLERFNRNGEKEQRGKVF